MDVVCNFSDVKLICPHLNPNQVIDVMLTVRKLNGANCANKEYIIMIADMIYPKRQ